jgi:predicted  nucleic acid-binding Zn-ribbon protein
MLNKLLSKVKDVTPDINTVVGIIGLQVKPQTSQEDKLKSKLESAREKSRDIERQLRELRTSAADYDPNIIVENPEIPSITKTVNDLNDMANEFINSIKARL